MVNHAEYDLNRALQSSIREYLHYSFMIYQISLIINFLNIKSIIYFGDLEKLNKRIENQINSIELKSPVYHLDRCHAE